MIQSTFASNIHSLNSAVQKEADQDQLRLTRTHLDSSQIVINETDSNWDISSDYSFKGESVLDKSKEIE